MKSYPTDGWITEQGYLRVVDRNHPWQRARGYIYEHVRVVEILLGRRLKRNETVHHIDEDKLNNDPKNLIVKTRRSHGKLHWSQFKRDSKGRFKRRIR